MENQPRSNPPEKTYPSDVSLVDIANWQLAPPCEDGFSVELPKLQRGFVWESSKVMDLWDSILRGFPIGSMMLSSIGSDSLQRYWMLDGQQRATSIAIGYYNPWNPELSDPAAMWSLGKKSPKGIPTLWLDLKAERRAWDVKMFFPYLATQSHPWGYSRDGGVIAWGKRREAHEAFLLGANYTSSDLSQCFPWEATLPVPLAILMEAADRKEVISPEEFWKQLRSITDVLPPCWKKRHDSNFNEEPPNSLAKILNSIRQLTDYRVHLNLLSREASENDVNTDDDNSLLFVRLNTGGVVLGGEELIFSLFKSAFPQAKDAVEECAAGFMVPSKLFGLLVRLVASREEPAKLAKPVSLAEFKKEIRSGSPMKGSLEAFIQSEVAELMKTARGILCGDGNSATNFWLPEAVATRTINASPDIFLGLLYWLRGGGKVDLGSEDHRRLLGRFTALSWFLPGNARAKLEALREWVSYASADLKGRMWSDECFHRFFIRNELALPVFPPPEHLGTFLHQGVLKVEAYHYDQLPASDPESSLWNSYTFLPMSGDESEDLRRQHREGNMFSLLNHLVSCRQILLYAQRTYIRQRFQAFDQWETTLKDTNCPWDWDHIYPSTYYRKNPNPIYKDWHGTIGNLRARGLSENRSDGCDWPSEKLKGKNEEDGIAIRRDSFVSEILWLEKIKGLENRHDAVKNEETARAMCDIVLARLVAIYDEWYRELRIGSLTR